MDDAENAFALHSFKIDVHQIVMGKVYDAVAGGCGNSGQQKRKKNRGAQKSHRADDQRDAAR
jgi:hypothetical protein